MSTWLKRPVPASELASALGFRLHGDDVSIESVAPLSSQRGGALMFSVRVVSVELPSNVAVISESQPAIGAWLQTERPRLAFTKALAWLDRTVGFDRPTAPPEIDPSVTIGSGVSLGRGVVIGAGTILEHNIRIGDGVRIGRDCWIKSGAVVGEAGFGFERDTDGTPIRMTHLGGVLIGDRVEVGSLTTVCQGTLTPTVLEDDVKVDDHVHVAHNVLIKKKSMVIACAEISGGVVLGEESWIAPNASVRDGVKIGDRVVVGLGAVVVRDVEADLTVAGNPARVLTPKVRP